MKEQQFVHFKPESVYAPESEKSRELAERTELEFVVDPATGKIEKIGDPRDVNEWLEEEKKRNSELLVTPEIGGVALPGSTDAHQHLMYGTLELIGAGYVFGAGSKGELINQLKREIKQKDKTPQIFIGHNTANIPDFGRREIDDITSKSGKPIAVFDASFHGARLNGPMLELVAEAAKKERESGYQITGTIDRETGQVTEGYSILTLQVAEAHCGVEEMSEKMEKTLDGWIDQGITDIHELFPTSWEEFIAILVTKKKWEEERKTDFPVRQFFMEPVIFGKLRKMQAELEKSGIFNPDRDWKMMGIKLVADGSFGTYTAMTSEEYDNLGGKGIEFHSIKTLNKAIQMARESGIENIAMHAIGDEGIQRAIEIAKRWKSIAEKAELNPTQFRIDHFELPNSQQIKEVGKLGIWVNSEPNFLTDYVYSDRLANRVTQICPHADIISRGIPMHFGSDGMPTSALFGIWAATHHPNPRERISFEQALAAYSLTAADYEHNYGRGRIAKGASADIVILKKEGLNKLLQGESSPEEFARMGKEGTADMVTELESNIARVYRQGRLVKKSK
ncbi:MAG: amidohydrolase family protein [Patescibacteria group bacterium]